MRRKILRRRCVNHKPIKLKKIKHERNFRINFRNYCADTSHSRGIGLISRVELYTIVWHKLHPMKGSLQSKLVNKQVDGLVISVYSFKHMVFDLQEKELEYYCSDKSPKTGIKEPLTIL